MFNTPFSHTPDPVEDTFRRAMADPRADVINLSIGVFRDATGNVPILESVRIAEQRVQQSQTTKSYRMPAGNEAYCTAIENLILGPDHTDLKGGRLKSIQTPGAGAALRVAAELIKSLSPHSKIWFPNPVWDHQPDFFTAAGLQKQTHRYYDSQSSQLDFEGMLEDLAHTSPDDVLVLHGCCHNPTGEDLTLEQWRIVADLVAEKKIIPLVDIAYQGFGDGIFEDVAGVRLFLEKIPEAIIAVSSSKSFGVYRDRAGALIIKNTGSLQQLENIYLHLIDLVRSLYFMPPDQSAEIIRIILGDEILSEMWRTELDQAREDVKKLRAECHRALQQAVPDFDFSFMLRQKGMFSCLPLTEQNRLAMEKEEGIYLMPGGRINFAALSESTIERTATVLPRFLDRH